MFAQWRMCVCECKYFTYVVGIECACLCVYVCLRETCETLKYKLWNHPICAAFTMEIAILSNGNKNVLETEYFRIESICIHRYFSHGTWKFDKLNWNQKNFIALSVLCIAHNLIPFKPWIRCTVHHSQWLFWNVSHGMTADLFHNIVFLNGFSDVISWESIDWLLVKENNYFS